MTSTNLLLLVSILHLLLLLHTVHSTVLCIDKEKHALLDFKQSFVADLDGVLSNWRIDNDDCCKWDLDMVSCDNRTGHVISLAVGGGLMSYRLRPSLLELQHLTSLDLSENYFSMGIPDFIGSLTKLTYLDLSGSGFYGKIPPHLGNLTRLQALYLGEPAFMGASNGLFVDNLQWLSHLSSLNFLNLSHVDLSNATDWLSTLKRLPSLSEFRCTSCSLPPPTLSSLSPVNSSTSLQVLELSDNSMHSSTFFSLINGTRLKELYLDHVDFGKNLHAFLGPLIGSARYSLEVLVLSSNSLKELPIEVTMFPSLTRLFLSSNTLEKLSSHDFKSMTNLQELDISHNQINMFPDLSALSSLIFLNASLNRISGNAQQILQHLPTNMIGLDLSGNSLYGAISQAHLSLFSELKALLLSDNNLLTFNFSESWVPPFQLSGLELRSCKIGPGFPNWILTQKTLSHLDMSNTTISGAIPTAFWNFSIRLEYLNLSFNNIQCSVPNLSLPSAIGRVIIDLSSNSFYGPIPLFLFPVPVLDLSNNRFSSFPPSQHRILSSSFYRGMTINLSNNNLSGSLPNWLCQSDSLLVLNLANNMLYGRLPVAIGSLWRLTALHLNNNRFSGQLPSSMKNCTWLTILELTNNRFSGAVPFWLGESMPQLIVLNLRSNHFSGELPSSVCHLQSLQLLDISDNRISGYIPGCVHNFTSMATDKCLNFCSLTEMTNQVGFSIINSRVEFLDYASILWKGALAPEHSRNLQQRNVIDLSGNCLTGQIPTEVTTLKGLQSLDLSRNYLHGSIPDKIGEMKSLEYLILSFNRLSGEIPGSLAGLTFLGTLNLSSNNLHGKIPTSTQLDTFGPSSYAGNPKLCGKPLATKCPGDEQVEKQPLVGEDHYEEGSEPFNMQAFYAALGTGFAFSFLVVLGVLNFSTHWRHAFFGMASDIADWIFVKTTLCRSRIKRSLCHEFQKANGIADL